MHCMKVYNTWQIFNKKIIQAQALLMLALLWFGQLKVFVMCRKSDFIKEAFRILKPGGRLVVADFFRKDNLQRKDAEQVKRWANGWAIEDYATKEIL